MAESPLAHFEESAPAEVARATGFFSSDEALVRRCQQGEWEAFDLLMRQHEAKVYNIAYRMLGHPEDASDAAQEVFIRIYHALPKFRGECAFSTWLYRIAVNVCLDAVRRRARQPSIHESALVDTEEEADFMDHVPDVHPDPERVVMQKELQRLVHEAIQTLSESQRVVLVLYDLEGFTYEEIAAMLRTSIGTVKSRLNRARLALKAKLEPFMEQLQR
ncbi:MAG: sigma-70 family RNA polymerase sigma factor [Abditibacteriales bacterium]|nr:sigma-70 family RNA polymerase sigma factor [Abditibacteriales bacterium]MDW8367918.1 sigma-70 family RNA polymerase sigma factor [Abditibacteriales bacterium]